MPPELSRHELEQLEQHLERAIRTALDSIDLPRGRPAPSPRLFHLMAKAAATVYEATIESTGERRR